MNTQEDILNMIATEAMEQEPPSILDQLTAANKRIEELERMLEKVLASAHPHPAEHPGMYAAWQQASRVLKGEGE